MLIFVTQFLRKAGVRRKRGSGSSLVSIAVSGQGNNNGFSAVARDPWDSSGVLLQQFSWEPGLTPLAFVLAVAVPLPVPSRGHSLPLESWRAEPSHTAQPKVFEASGKHSKVLSLCAVSTA